MKIISVGWDKRHMCTVLFIDLPNTCVVIIKFTFEFGVLYWFNLYDDSCFRLLCSLSFMAIFLLSLFHNCLVVW
jgi:hypothetical protein